MARILPRLVRKQGGPPNKRRPASPVERLDFELVNDGLRRVEWLVREHLGREEAPVHYVENTLLTSLFGLLCWDAIFLAIPGAFFHPYQREPADLRLPGFRERRAEAFAACLARLDDGSYPTVIRERFASKRGLASPFVAWGILSSELLDQALACLPAAVLRTVAGGSGKQPHRLARPDPVLAGGRPLPHDRGQGPGRPPAGQPAPLAGLLRRP